MPIPDSLKERLVLPAMAAPMFLASGKELAVACCRAGIIGSLTRNHFRSNAEFEQQLAEVTAALKILQETEPNWIIGPLAANVSVNMDARERTEALDICRRYAVDIVVTEGGDPALVTPQIHDWGGTIFHDATSIRFAEKAVAAGVDGMIAIGAGGGGHSGMVSPLALVPQIRAMFDGTLVMAGAVAHGAAIRAAEVLGADMACLGTRFIATRESMAPEAYKALLLSQGSADLLYSSFATGVPAVWLTASMREHGIDPTAPPLPKERGTSDHLPEGAKPWVNMWSAGQGIGLIDDIPSVAEVVARLRTEYREAVSVVPFTGNDRNS